MSIKIRLEIVIFLNLQGSDKNDSSTADVSIVDNRRGRKNDSDSPSKGNTDRPYASVSKVRSGQLPLTF